MNGRNRSSSLLLAVSTILLAACASTTPRMPVSGTPEALSAIAGEWSGEYTSLRSGRTGAITFQLAANADSATGEVLMLDPATRGPQRSGDPPARHPDFRSSGEPGNRVEGVRLVAQPLSVSFVRAVGRRVTGRLDPYVDPDCACTVTTVFEGLVKGNVIEGTYTTRREAGEGVVRGEWKVKRRRK